jgi:hypothetical protein
MDFKKTLKKTYKNLTSEKTKANFKKGLGEIKELGKKAGASVSKARDSYLEHDEKHGGGLGLLK